MLGGAEIETSTDSILDRSAPAWQFYRRASEYFGEDEVLAVAIEGAEPYSTVALRSVLDLSDRLDGVQGVRRVDSLSTLPLVRQSGDGFVELEPVLAPGFAGSESERSALALAVDGDPIAKRLLASDDGRVLAVNVYLEPAETAAYEAVVDEVEQFAASASARVSGVPIFRIASNRQLRSELVKFVPLAVIAVGAVLLAAFRSWTSVLVCLLVSGAGTAVVSATMIAAGFPLTFTTLILPSILLALGAAYTMHFLTAARGVGSHETLSVALVQVVGPVALSGITTAIGFLAVATVRIEAITLLGVFGSLGVCAVFAASATLAPALLSLIPLGDGVPDLDRWLRGPARRWIVSLVARRRSAIVAIWLAVCAVAVVGLTRLEVETDATRWFARGTDVRDSYEWIRDELSGISPINVVLEAGPETRLDSAEGVQAIARLGDELRRMEHVGKVLSLADPLGQLHAGFGGVGLPETDDLVMQYMMLLESVDYTRDLVTADGRRANVVLRVDNNGSSQLLAVARGAERAWQSHGLSDVSARATGIMFEFARVQDDIASGQLRGLLVAFAAVGLALLVVVGRPLLAILASLPNALPILVWFGMMGWARVPLDAGSVILGSLALGIAVDDTIHVVANYRRARGRGVDPYRSMHESLHRVLPALVFTTVTISVGFGLIGLSEFALTRNLGLFTAGLVGLCLLADVTLLPSLLLWLEGAELKPGPPPADPPGDAGYP